ncbi:unnamed protein product, partial [Prorocentrum cordatum]
ASPAFVLPPPQEAVKRTLQSDGHAPDLAADDDEGPFCCFAATDVANVCATCVARPKRGGFCASSSASCGQCVASSLAAWCLGPSSPAFVLGDPAWAPRNGTPRAPGLADAAALAQKAAAGRSAPAAGPSAAAARAARPWRRSPAGRWARSSPRAEPPGGALLARGVAGPPAARRGLQSVHRVTRGPKRELACTAALPYSFGRPISPFRRVVQEWAPEEENQCNQHELSEVRADFLDRR